MCLLKMILPILCIGSSMAKAEEPPPPAIISIVPSVIEENKKWEHVTITGKSENGSAYYDSPEGHQNRLKVEIKDVKIISVKLITPTRIDIIVSTDETPRKSFKEIKITNPDGQSVAAKHMLQIIPKGGVFRTSNYKPRFPEDIDPDY